MKTLWDFIFNPLQQEMQFLKLTGSYSVPYVATQKVGPS